MKTIKKTIQIDAPKEKVWNVLLEDDYNRIWMAEFMEGSHAKTDWIVGHTVRFLDAKNSGIVGKIAAKQPYDLIEIVYDGEVKNGEDDFESDSAKAMKGAKENYYLSEENGVTTLSIESDMDDSYADMMSVAWDKALDKIGELSISI